MGVKNSFMMTLSDTVYVAANTDSQFGHPSITTHITDGQGSYSFLTLYCLSSEDAKKMLDGWQEIYDHLRTKEDQMNEIEEEPFVTCLDYNYDLPTL